jgi:ASCH domain
MAATTTSAADVPASLPTIKFFKDAVADILAGIKTLEPRPRSMPWIRRLDRAGCASLAYGPRVGAPTVFAVARITGITLRAFETATAADLRRIGTPWRDRSPEEFSDEYNRWFAKELAKGYPVAWISFELVDE